MTDPVPNSLGWRRDETGVLPGGDVDDDWQVGNSYSVRYRLPARPGALATVYYVGEDFAHGEDDRPRYGLTRITEMLRCSDPDDPGSSELWSNYRYEPLNSESKLTSAADVEAAARELTETHEARAIDWDGLADWEPRFTDAQLLRRIRTRTNGGIVTVTTYDAGTGTDGHDRIGYICERDHVEIFRGDDIGVPAGRVLDSDYVLAAVTDFLSLRPGDTDPDYFEGYTKTQAEFADACGDELGLYSEALRGHSERAAAGVGASTTGTIGGTRRALERMSAEANELARELEELQASLATADLDQATLAEIADILDAAAICRASAETALAGVNTRHTALEQAIAITPHPAKTRFYRH